MLQIKYKLKYNLMEQKQKESSSKSKSQKLYSFCRISISILLALISSIPIIYLLGTDQSFYSNQPLYPAYAKSNYFQGKLLEVQTALNNSFVVNVYTSQNSQKKDYSKSQWENLEEFVDYIGYNLNKKGMVTVDKLITPPEVKQQKKSKSNSNGENQLLIQKTYSLENIGLVNIIKNKVNKIAAGTMNRLKIKVKQNKDSSLISKLKFSAVKQVLGQRVWIITLDPNFNQYHSPQELRKQLIRINKQRELDRFIVVSLTPADPEWKKIKGISININDSVLENIKNQLKNVVKAYFEFQINATRVIQIILCRSQTSLQKLSHFIARCNLTFNCYNSIKISSKSQQKVQKSFDSQLKQLCDNGRFDEEKDYRPFLTQLGFYLNEENQKQIEETLKTYYEIGSDKRCKGSKKCSFNWLIDKKLKKQENKPVSKDKQKQSVKAKQEQKPVAKKQSAVKKQKKTQKDQKQDKNKIKKQIKQILVKDLKKTKPKQNEQKKKNIINTKKTIKDKQQIPSSKQKVQRKKQQKDTSKPKKYQKPVKNLNKKVSKKNETIKTKQSQRKVQKQIQLTPQQQQINQIKSNVDIKQHVEQVETSRNKVEVTHDQNDQKQQQQTSPVVQTTQQSSPVEIQTQEQVIIQDQTKPNVQQSVEKQEDIQNIQSAPKVQTETAQEIPQQSVVISAEIDQANNIEADQQSVEPQQAQKQDQQKENQQQTSPTQVISKEDDQEQAVQTQPQQTQHSEQQQQGQQGEKTVQQSGEQPQEQPEEPPKQQPQQLEQTEQPETAKEIIQPPTPNSQEQINDN